MDIEEVLRSYVDTALCLTDGSNGDPLDDAYNISDLDSETLEIMRADVEKFVNENQEDLRTWCGEGGTTAEEQAGHDFWCNRNGHGVGFWESEWGEPGERLDKACESFGEFYLGVNHLGQISYL